MMKFDTYIPVERLRPYIKYLAVSEGMAGHEYKVFPSTGLVMGFQYKGHLAVVKDNGISRLASAGITGISDSYKIFRNSAQTGTVLVYFTEIGFIYFASCPANELFNLSISLDDLFGKSGIDETEDRLVFAATDKERIAIIENFLLSHLKNKQADKLITEAIRLIYQTKGTIRIKELNRQLCISPSPFEKRFRAVVGATPKKFASIIRFNAVIDTIGNERSLTEIGYDNGFFDQAHFIKDFKHFTGDTPESFRRFL